MPKQDNQKPMKHKDQERFAPVNGKPSTGRGTHSVTFIQKKKNGARFVQLSGEDKDGYKENPFVFEYAAIASEMARIISTSIFPKVRVITEEDSNGNRTNIGMASRLVDGYTGAYDVLKTKEPKDLDTAQLAALFVGSYFTAENDLHNDNWGVDKDGNVRRIDFDQALYDHTAGFQDQAEASHDTETIKKWPNLIYARKDAFPITRHDVENFPILHHAKPANWPSSHQDMQDHMESLKKDPVFKKEKWFNFTKLILTSDQQIDSICDAHSRDSKEKTDLNSYLKERRNNLKKVLMSCPEYREFLKNFSETDKQRLMKELKEYNKQFQYKSNKVYPGESATPGDTKPKYRDRVFATDTQLIAKINELQSQAKGYDVKEGEQLQLIQFCKFYKDTFHAREELKVKMNECANSTDYYDYETQISRLKNDLNQCREQIINLYNSEETATNVLENFGISPEDQRRIYQDHTPITPQQKQKQQQGHRPVGPKNIHPQQGQKHRRQLAGPARPPKQPNYTQRPYLPSRQQMQSSPLNELSAINRDGSLVLPLHAPRAQAIVNTAIAQIQRSSGTQRANLVNDLEGALMQRRGRINPNDVVAQLGYIGSTPPRMPKNIAELSLRNQYHMLADALTRGLVPKIGTPPIREGGVREQMLIAKMIVVKSAYLRATGQRDLSPDMKDARKRVMEARPQNPSIQKAIAHMRRGQRPLNPHNRRG